MTGHPVYLLFDTSIWLDFYLSSRKGHNDAMRLYEAAKASGVEILYAFVSLKDVYYLINVSLKREAIAHNGSLAAGDAESIQLLAWECAKNMMECATPVGADISDAWRASKLQRIHSDFEDDLIIAACHRANCDYLVTNDKTLLKNAPVSAISCKEALAYINQ